MQYHRNIMPPVQLCSGGHQDRAEQPRPASNRPAVSARQVEVRGPVSAVRGNMTGVQIRARVRVHAGARGPHLPGLHLPRRGLGGLQPPGPAGRRAAIPGLAPRLRSPHPGVGLDNYLYIICQY